jgi:hypothetical protein
MGAVTECYSSGAVSSSGGNIGGLVGYSGYATGVTECFWDTQTSGQVTSDGGTGLTTAQMQDIRTYQEAGWDFLGSKDGLHETWQMPAGGGYPVLAILSGYVPPRLRGRGMPEDPYLISNATELGAMVYYRLNAHYRLVASIDLSGIHWRNAVIPWLAGTFNGSGHTISHLTITGKGYLGLVGRLGGHRSYEHTGEVRDLGVVDVNVVGSAAYVGGLAGHNNGTVINCRSSGAVSGGWEVGGLVGWNTHTIVNSYSAGSVAGTRAIGGLVGENGYMPKMNGPNPFYASVISKCYSVSAVRGPASGGGLVGLQSSGSVTGCFWDTQTSGQATSAGGTGKTTAEMQTAMTFLETGWDFMGETANGTVDIWWINEGKDYPRLWWETK